LLTLLWKKGFGNLTVDAATCSQNQNTFLFCFEGDKAEYFIEWCTTTAKYIISELKKNGNEVGPTRNTSKRVR
jgi:hypothetical protein